MANGYGGSSGSSSSSSRRTTSSARVTPTTQRLPAPEGFHYMPDGTLMSDVEHARLYGAATIPQKDKVIKSFALDLSDLPGMSVNRSFTISSDKDAEFILEIKNEDNYYYNFVTNLFQATKTKLEKTIITGSYKGSIVFPSTITKDTVNGAVSSGVKIVMDTAVASTMAVGDRVTGNSVLDSTVVTVAALDPDGDNANEFSLSSAVAIADGVNLFFSGDKQYDVYLYAKPGTVHQNYTEFRFPDGTLDINSSSGSNSLMMQKVIYQYANLSLIIIPYSPNSVANLIKSSTRIDSALTISRGKNNRKIPFRVSCEVNDAAKAYQIKRQPTTRDLLALTSLTVDATPELLPGEDIYPTAREAFTGDDVNGAVTGDVIIRMDNSDLSEVIAVGDKITSPITTDDVDGAVLGGVKVVMDNNVAENMAVGDQVTSAIDSSPLNSTASEPVTVIALDPDEDNPKEFSLSEAVEFIDGERLIFSSKANRELTTVTVVETGGTATDFTISREDIYFRDNQELTFTPQKNYQWSVDNIDKLQLGMPLLAGTNVTAGSITDNYQDSITIFEGTDEEEVIIKNEKQFKDTKGQKPTVVKGLVTAQAGNVIFNNQQVLAFGGGTQTLATYGIQNILNSYDYEVDITDLKISLAPITTTTTSSTVGSSSTSVVVASRNGILDNVSTVSGIGIDPKVANPTVASGAGAVSGAGTIVLSVAQELESGITLTFPGAGQVATITGNIEVLKAGTASQNIYIDVEKLLSIT